jgi:hypothetical protein
MKSQVQPTPSAELPGVAILAIFVLIGAIGAAWFLMKQRKFKAQTINIRI